MAILNKIRQRSIFLILIIALALFAFVLSDVLTRSGSDVSKQSTLATINGEKINREDFARKVEQQEQRSGATGSRLRSVNAVWNQEVNRIVLEEQYEKLGITVTEERLNELLKNALQNNPTFQDADGFFSPGKMQEYIATVKNDPAQYGAWLNFEKNLENQERQDIYYNLIKAGVGATDKDGEVAYKLDGNTVDLQFVQIPYTSIADEDVNVSKSEIEAYINDHKSEFETEATRSIRFVKFDDKPTLEDEKAIEATLAELLVKQKSSNGLEDPGLKDIPADQVPDFIAEYSDVPYENAFVYKAKLPASVRDSLYTLEEGDTYGPYKDANFILIDRVMETSRLPDSVRSRHILVSYLGAQRSPETRTKEEAKSLADSILNVVKRNKSKFGDLAASFSSDASNKDKDGDLDYQRKNTFVPEFDAFIFEGKKGDLDIVETPFGYHIIEVLDQKNFQKVQKLATVAKEIIPSNSTLSAVYNETQKFEIAARDGKFDEVAEASSYTVRPVNAIKPLDETLPGQGFQRSIVQWAFEDETSVGDIKRFQVTNGYIVAQVTKRTKEGLMDATTASARVTPILRNKKKAKQISSTISGTDLNAIATANDQQVKTVGALSMSSPTIAGAGNEPKVVGTAFSLNESETSGPIEGTRGVYVVKVTKKANITDLDSYSAQANQEAIKARESVTTKVIAALKEAADIDDKRATFY